MLSGGIGVPSSHPGFSGYTVSCRIHGFVLDALADVGLDTHRVLAACGGLELGDDPDRRLPVESLLSLWERAVDVADNPDLGLQAAERIPLGARAALDYLLRSAPTLGEGIVLGSRYARVLDDTVLVSVEHRGNTVDVVCRAPETVVLQRVHHDYRLARLMSTIRGYLGKRIVPAEVHFPYPKPDHTRVHRALFGSTLRFNRPDGRLRLPAEWLEWR
ncbi:MAG: AraC family transcriptional regulator, partial [Myxococcota bacterium]